MKYSPHQNPRVVLVTAIMMMLAGPGRADDNHHDDKKEKESHGDIRSLNGLTGRVTLSPGPGVVLRTNGNGLTISAPPVVPQNVWKTTGNAGTTAGANFLGTTDNQPLELKVNGQRGLRLEPNTNGAPNVIGGAAVNYVVAGIVGAVISGGGETNEAGHSYSNTVASNFGSIGGGNVNTIQADAGYSTISGGGNNTIQSNAWRSSIGGGVNNTIQAGAADSTIGGGNDNTIQLSSGSAISGGFVNTIQDGAGGSAIGGGYGNVIRTNAYLATIAGGFLNNVFGNAGYSAIGGGSRNAISGAADFSTISGGASNLIATFANGAVIGGGSFNTNAGPYAAIPGGDQNLAAMNGFAAGHRAKAMHQGAFVWTDATDADVASTAVNQFTVRASGGVRFFSDPNATVGVQLAAGGNSWAPASDRNLKENFQPANPREVLNRVAALPIQTYNMKTQDPSIRHIGPMAQDFRAAFAVGEDDQHIATVDADGVALAAIQGLNEVVKEKEGEIQRLKQRLDALEKLVQRFAAQIGAGR